MEDLSSRPAQEVLDDHLNIAQRWIEFFFDHAQALEAPGLSD